MKCKLCSHKITKFFSLGVIPLVNAFLKESDLKKEAKYDLSLGFCSNCSLVQLMKTVPPVKMFSHYLYFTSHSATMLKHCEETASYLKKRFNLKSNSLFFEIASNDGTLLNFVKKLNIKILGIDPAKNIANLANKKGLTTIPDFFNYKLAKKLASGERISADIVFGANILAHVPKIKDFIQGVDLILKPKGTAIFEFPYIKGLFENKFDTIYHEHVFYYGIISLINIFNEAGMEIYDIDKTPIQGGSLRIYISQPGSFKVSKAVIELVRQEKRFGYDKLSTYKKINRSAKQLKNKTVKLINSLTSKNKTIAAYGAPAKGVIILNYFGIGKRQLSFIVDKAKEKQGLYVPGVHLKVESPDMILKKMPDYVFILCWNLQNEVMKQLKAYKEKGGHFIVTVPKLIII